MSAAQMQKEAPEVAWPGLEALGLSQRELVLAEALQMEYDALSRLRQDKSEMETVHSPSCSSNPSPGGEGPQANTILRGLSGSSPSPGQLGGPDSPPSIPPRGPPPGGDHARRPLFILDASEDNQVKGSSRRLPGGPGSKCLNPLSDETPPALPPRIPISQWSHTEAPVLLGRESPASPDVNLFLPDVDQPKVAPAELAYDSLNEALLRLNRSGGGEGGPGKALARSKTLPPQVPPRTRPAVLKQKPQRVAADLVRRVRVSYLDPISAC